MPTFPLPKTEKLSLGPFLSETPFYIVGLFYCFTLIGAYPPWFLSLGLGEHGALQYTPRLLNLTKAALMRDGFIRVFWEDFRRN